MKEIQGRGPIAAVLIPVRDPCEGLAWYARAFPQGQRVVLGETDFKCLEVDGVRLEVVRSDDKVSCGPAGSVVYWRTDDFEARIHYLTSLGATLYRGPMIIEGGLQMCQLRDPWGNCIGVRGSVGSG